MSVKNKSDVYRLITDRIISLLEKGTIPWRQPWIEAGMPQNLVSGKYYRGINVFMLAYLNYEQSLFLTFPQVKRLGGTVRKGEKAHMVVFTKWIEKKTEGEEKPTRIPFLRHYWVFNIAQCEGLPESKIPVPLCRAFSPMRECQKVIEQMPACPDIRHNEHEAFYHPKHDFINMPKPETFLTSEDYYATLFHELIHSTGHRGRLARKELEQMTPYGSDIYSIEELIAELGACYLSSFAGIGYKPLDNHAAYIHHWLNRLKGDKKFVVYAAGQAQKAVDYILNLQNESYEQNQAA